jgi:hypothetical protein
MKFAQLQICSAKPCNLLLVETYVQFGVSVGSVVVAVPLLFAAHQNRIPMLLLPWLILQSFILPVALVSFIYCLSMGYISVVSQSQEISLSIFSHIVSLGVYNDL